MDELIYQDHNLIVYDETGITEKDYRRMFNNFYNAANALHYFRMSVICALPLIGVFDFITLPIVFLIYIILYAVFYILMPLAVEKGIMKYGDFKEFWNRGNEKIFGSNGFAYYIAKYGTPEALSISVERDNDTPALRILYDCNKVFFGKEYKVVDENLSFDKICQGDCKRAQIIFYREDDDIIKVRYLMAAA